MSQPESRHDLEQLHKASLNLDRLARQALSGDHEQRGALLQGMDRWVELVEGFVSRCPAGAALDAYRQATARFEAALGDLGRASQAAELSRLEGELPPVVEDWSQALTLVLQEVARQSP